MHAQCLVSIHAPRVGRDCKNEASSSAQACFNPRAPRGARQWRGVAMDPMTYVSIHAPRVGRDGGSMSITLRWMVSIHAPRVGRDSVFPLQPIDGMLFQSTRPAWGAT